MPGRGSSPFLSPKNAPGKGLRTSHFESKPTQPAEKQDQNADLSQNILCVLCEFSASFAFQLLKVTIKSSSAKDAMNAQ